jgi:hypothetical protein
MKKIRIILALCLLTAAGIPGFQAKAQAVEQGRVLIDLYYGFPNLWSATLRTVVRETALPIDLQTRSLGPFGGRVEYMATRHFGVGLDVYYARSEVSYTAQGQDLQGNPATYSYSVSVPRPRVLLRGNFHLGNSDMVDPYLALGLGYSGTRVVIHTDDPIFNKNSLSLPISIPVAYRVGFGTRVMLTRFVGLSGEIGIGGPLVTGGISIGL